MQMRVTGLKHNYLVNYHLFIHFLFEQLRRKKEKYRDYCFLTFTTLQREHDRVKNYRRANAW